MFFLLPCLALALSYLIFRRVVEGRRHALLAAAAVWAAIVSVITESLSALEWIDRAHVAAAWLAVAAIQAALLWKVWRRKALPAGLPVAGAMNVVLASTCAIITSIVGLIAFLAPPNTVDVVAYHAPRVAMWMQHHSVAHYATPITRQLVLAPLAEFIQLQFLVLTGGDTLSGVTHWFAYALTIVAASLLASRLGGGVGAQMLAAVTTATIPEGILTASGAKNDWTLALWLVCAAIFFLEYLDAPSRGRAWLTGLACCLAIFTKGTAFIFLPPMAFLCLLRRPAVPLRRVAWHAAIGASAFLILAPFLIRNHRDLGTVFQLPPDAPESVLLTNERYSPDVLYSNILRNGSLHLITSFPGVNRRLEAAVRQLHAMFGIDPDDPAATYSGLTYSLPAFRFHEAVIPNLLHFLLALAAAAVVAARPELRRGRTLVVALLVPALGAALFCAVLKWQLWHTRLHLPVFVFAAVAVGLVCTRISTRAAVPVVAALLVVSSYRPLFSNFLRPVLTHQSVLVQPRDALYYFDRLDNYIPYTAAGDAVRASGCRQVGFDGSRGEYHYPLFVQLGMLAGKTRIRYVNVPGPAGRLESRFDSFEPCAIVCLDCEPGSELAGRYRAALPNQRSFADVLVFTR